MSTQVSELPSFPASHHLPSEMDPLREEIERLTVEVIEANEERAQAAEYGLVVLEEKQALQSQCDELNSLYDATKRELETAVNTIKQVQTDYEKRLREVESQREQLLGEMESRETTLITRVTKQEEQIRQLERRLKQALVEQDRLTEHSGMLAAEIDKYRRDADFQKEELKKLKREVTDAWREVDEKKQEIDRLEKSIKKLSQFETDLPGIQEANHSLREENEALQEHYMSVLAEKEELEHQNQETMIALNEERHEKSQLEIKIREDELRSPVTPSWAAEKEATMSPTGRINLNNHNSSFSFPPVSPKHSEKMNSTAAQPNKPQLRPSLLSELQKSLGAGISEPELEALRQRLHDAEEKIVKVHKEKVSLEETIMSLKQAQSESGSDAERMKDELGKKVREIENLKEELIIKEEILGQLRSKLSSITAERTAMEIEVDGMKNELKRVQETTAVEVERCSSDCLHEQEKNLELRGQVTILEEQVGFLTESLQKLENIICNSHNELASMTDDIHNMHKVVVSLVTDGKVAPSSARNRSSSSTTDVAMRDTGAGKGAVGTDTLPQNIHPDSFYTLELKERKSVVQVHQESQALISITHLHDQLRSIRSPLEQFTKVMLERSLAHSAKHLPIADLKSGGSEERSSPSNSRRSTSDSNESSLNKWRAKLAVKTEEVNNLRAIMKARATTTEVSISSLRSNLEGQARAYQSELTRLKHQLRMLKKEKEEQISQRTMYSKRCEELSNEITRMKRDLENLRQDNSEVLTALNKTIQKKLDLSRELEEYKMEQERMRIIPKLLGSSRI